MSVVYRRHIGCAVEVVLVEICRHAVRRERARRGARGALEDQVGAEGDEAARCVGVHVPRVGVQDGLGRIGGPLLVVCDEVVDELGHAGVARGERQPGDHERHRWNE